MVSVAVPDPVIVPGSSPSLEMPGGRPDELPTASVTVPEKPVSAVMETSKVADSPDTMVRDGGLTAMSKSGSAGKTFTMTAGGLGSELPLASMAVSDTTYSPGEGKTTGAGLWSFEVAGE